MLTSYPHDKCSARQPQVLLVFFAGITAKRSSLSRREYDGEYINTFQPSIKKLIFRVTSIRNYNIIKLHVFHKLKYSSILQTKRIKIMILKSEIKSYIFISSLYRPLNWSVKAFPVTISFYLKHHQRGCLVMKIFPPVFWLVCQDSVKKFYIIAFPKMFKNWLRRVLRRKVRYIIPILKFW